MAINFPDSPSLNQIFEDTTSGFSFQWDGEVWKSYVDPTIGNVTKLDDISGSFNGITTSFALTVNGSAATADLDPAKVILSLGGVVQNPVDDYYITGTNLIFTTAPAASLTFFASVYETGIAKSYISSSVVSPSNLTTGGFSWNTGGDLYISGVSTISNTGTATTALYVSGNARIAGILTVGSSSITLDGTNNTIKVGTALTLSSSGVTAGIITGKLYGSGANLTGVGIGTAGSVNTSGIVTAAKFYGDGSNLTNVGVGTQSSVNTSGIVTAGSFYGDGSSLTNLGGPLQPLTYSPAIGATGVSQDTNIVITFNKPLKVNTGTITLRSGSASGTI
ncbi:hypothetical protein EBT31_21870, partial [bacterium]|nr:hypothetical protein [bacterium]